MRYGVNLPNFQPSANHRADKDKIDAGIESGTPHNFTAYASMSQPKLTQPTSRTVTGYGSVAPELTLSETLRVLEVARGMRQERAVAEVALARNEIRDIIRKRLMEAAAITGDSLTEADVDAAIDQYFSTQHAYSDPPLSVPVFFANLYVRRIKIVMISGSLLLVYVLWKFLL